MGLLHRKCENDNLLESNYKFIRDFNRIFLDIWLTLFSRIIIYENKPYINNDKQQQIYSSTLLLLQSKSTKSSSSKPKSKKPAKSSKSLPSLSTEKILYLIISFLETFNGSLKFIWLMEFNNNYNNSDSNQQQQIDGSIFSNFVKRLLKLFNKKMIMNNNNNFQEENIYLESLFGLVFDKLLLDVPLEVIIKEKNELEKIIISFNSSGSSRNNNNVDDDKNSNWLRILEERIKALNDYYNQGNEKED